MMMTQQTGVSLFSNFSGLVIKGFGYTQLKALLLQIPAWAVATITVITIGSLASRTRFWRNRKTVNMQRAFPAYIRLTSSHRSGC